MSTIIDSLIVELGIDTKAFTPQQTTAVKKLGDLEKAAEKTEKSTRKVQKASKDAAQSINELSRNVTAFLSVLGGSVALKTFVSDFIETNAQLERLSKNLGLSVETISAWSNASEKLGGTAQGLQGTLDMLSKAQTQLMITGESSLLPYMSALGISLADTAGKARPVTDILLDLSDRFSHMDRTTANNLGRMFGLDQGTLNLLLQGRKELELEIARQKEQTAVTKEQAAVAQKFQTQIAGIRQQFAALGRSLFMEAAPILENILQMLQRFGDWAQTHEQFIADFFKVLAVGLAAVAIAAAPINLTVAALVALAGAIALVWEDYQVWKKGGDSFIDWAKWEPGIQKAIDKITELRDLIKDTFGWLNSIANKDKQAYAGAVNDSSKKRFEFGNPIKWFLGKDYDPNSQGAKFLNSIFGQGGVLAQSDPKSVLSDSSLSTRARAIAKQVSAQTGISESVIYGAFAHETGNFTNRGARELNNFAGVNVPGGKGQDYRKFGSDAEFASYYANLLKTLYPGSLGTQTAADFAHGLKNGVNGRQYFSDSESNYANGIQSLLNSSQYASSVAGVPGAASIVTNAPAATGAPSSTIDKSVQVSIGTQTINTKATDAEGIAGDMIHSLDYLFTAQANSGMN
jgi:hypothetical protein